MKAKPQKSDSEKLKDDVYSKGYMDIPRPAVICSDPDQLVQFVLKERGMNPYTSVVLTGMDDGQGFCKIAAVFLDTGDDLGTQGRAKYSDGVAPKNFKNSSVKKLMILAVVPNVPENHPNMQAILSELNMQAVEFSVSADVKMLNCLTGKASGQPKFGCPFCNTGVPYNKEEYDLYTLGDLEDWHESYIQAGSKHTLQQNFQNVINPPLLHGPRDKRVLGHLNIPELHLLIGIVDKLIAGFENKVFETPVEGREWMDRYLKGVAIVRKSYQGCHSLEGNQSSSFLKKIDVLEREIMKEDDEVKVAGLQYIQVFRALREVQEACFSMVLMPDFKVKINLFSNLYRQLGITVTPKVHILESHIIDFYEITGEKVGLGFFSEQGFESMHHDMKVSN